MNSLCKKLSGMSIDSADTLLDALVTAAGQWSLDPRGGRIAGCSRSVRHQPRARSAPYDRSAEDDLVALVAALDVGGRRQGSANRGADAVRELMPERWVDATAQDMGDRLRAASTAADHVPWCVVPNRSDGGASFSIVSQSPHDHAGDLPVVVFTPAAPESGRCCAEAVREAEITFKALWETAHLLSLRAAHGDRAYRDRLSTSVRLLRELRSCAGSVPEIPAARRRVVIGAYSVALNEHGGVDSVSRKGVGSPSSAEPIHSAADACQAMSSLSAAVALPDLPASVLCGPRMHSVLTSVGGRRPP